MRICGDVSLLAFSAAWRRGRLRRARSSRQFPVVGFLHAGVASAHTHVVAALRQGLKESSYVEGQNLAIEYRWAERSKTIGCQKLRPTWSAFSVDVIAATGGAPSALAAKAATSTIPIVLAIGADPLRRRPGCQPQPAWRQRYRSDLHHRPS